MADLGMQPEELLRRAPVLRLAFGWLRRKGFPVPLLKFLARPFSLVPENKALPAFPQQHAGARAGRE